MLGALTGSRAVRVYDMSVKSLSVGRESVLLLPPAGVVVVTMKWLLFGAKDPTGDVVLRST